MSHPLHAGWAAGVMLVQPSVWSKVGTALPPPPHDKRHRGPAAVGLCFLEIKSIRSLCLLLKAKARQAELAPHQAPFAHGEGMGHPWVCAGIGCPPLGGGSP